MEEKTFRYTKPSRPIYSLLAYVSIYYFFYLLDPMLFAIIASGTFFVFLSMPFICFISIYRAFFVTITFTDNYVIYKGLFKKVVLENIDIKDFVIPGSTMEGSTSPEIFFYTEERDTLGNSNKIMIGYFDYYPSTSFSLFFKPSDVNYITIMYRKELKPYLDRLVK